MPKPKKKTRAKAKLGDNRLGNQFWKLKSKHGRDKLYSTPELLWEAACEYFQWCDDHPWERVETTVKTSGTDVKTIPTERPYTIEGWCLYSDASRSWWKEFKKAKHKDFLPVTTRIDEIIYKQKFEGAAVGVFNASIIARDLGLVDKKENKTTVDFSGDTSDELDNKMKAIWAKIDEHIS